MGVDLSDERHSNTSEELLGRKSEGYCVKTLDINVNNSSIIINII